MITIYSAVATDFSGNGLCVLAPSSCIVTETLNGEWELSLIHPVDDQGKWAWLQAGSIIKAPVPADVSPRRALLAASEGRDVYRVNTSGTRLKLFSKPSSSSICIGQYSNAAQVQVLNKSNPTYYEVFTPEGQRGYMASAGLSFVKTVATNSQAMAEVILPAGSREQPFRVYRITPELTQVTVYARHLSYDLMDNMIYAYKPANGTAGSTIAKGLLSSCQTGHAFTMFSNLTQGVSDLAIENVNPLDALLGDGGLAEKTGGEFLRDWYDVYLLQRAGRDTDIQIRQGKNLLGIRYDVDDANVVTRLVPTGENEDGVVLYLDEKHIDSTNIGAYPHPRWAHLPVSEARVSAEMSLAQVKTKLRQAAQAEFNKGCDLPDVSIDVSFINLADTLEYAQYRPLGDIFLGDSVRVIVKTLSLEVTLRMTQYSFDCLLERYTKMTLGTAAKSVAGSMISPRQLPVGGIKGMKLAMGAIGTGHLQTASIGSLQVKTAAIGAAHIQQAAIGEAHIEDAAITSAKIGEAAIDSAKIQDGAIVNAKIYSGDANELKIGSANIAQGAIGTAQIDDAAVTNAKIGTAAITSAKIGFGEINTALIADAAVTAAKINDAAITSAKIEDAAITSAKIADASIEAAHIQDAAITAAKIGLAAIETANIADAAITSAKIGLAQVENAHIGNAAILSANIADASITSAKIQNGAIEAIDIKDAAVETAKIHDLAVTTGKIADLAVDRAKIADLAVDNAKITDAAITTAKIGDLAVTNVKIYSGDAEELKIQDANIAIGSIETAHIADGTITSAKIYSGDIEELKVGSANIASAAIGETHIQDGTITNAKIYSGEAESLKVQSANIATGAITNALIANEAVETAQIADGSITDAKIVELTANKINAGELSVERLIIAGSDQSIVYALNNMGELESQSISTLDGDTLTPRSITADKIVANAITANEIASRTITANEILASSITSNEIAGSTIKGDNIQAGAISTGHIDAEFGKSLDLSSNTSINAKVTGLQSAIDNKADSDALSDYVKDTDVTTMVESQVNQTASSIKTSISTLQKTVDGEDDGEGNMVGGIVNEFGKFRTTVETWQEFSQDGLRLGRSDSPYQVLLTPTELQFLENGAKIAYISNNKLYITASEIVNQFVIGNNDEGYITLDVMDGGLTATWRAKE